MATESPLGCIKVSGVVLAFVFIPLVFGIGFLAVDDYGRVKFDLPRKPSRVPVPRTREAFAELRAMNQRLDQFEKWPPRVAYFSAMAVGGLALGIVFPVVAVLLSVKSRTGNPIAAVYNGVQAFFGGWVILVFCAIPILVGQAMLQDKSVGWLAAAFGFSP